MSWKSVPYDAHISIKADGVELYTTYRKNVGSMENTKRIATRFAKEHGFKPKGNWEIRKTYYAPTSEMPEGAYWESEGYRDVFDVEKQIRATLKVLRS